MRKILLIVSTLVSAACGSERESSDRVLTAAKWPDTANTYRAETGAGCLPRSMLEFCEVPEGSVLHSDGTITTPAGQSARCDAACQFSDYTLECYAGPGVGAEIPQPSGSLGCRAVPIPTPSNVLFYCCPGIPWPAQTFAGGSRESQRSALALCGSPPLRPSALPTPDVRHARDEPEGQGARNSPLVRHSEAGHLAGRVERMKKLRVARNAVGIIADRRP